MKSTFVFISLSLAPQPVQEEGGNVCQLLVREGARSPSITVSPGVAECNFISEGGELETGLGLSLFIEIIVSESTNHTLCVFIDFFLF